METKLVAVTQPEIFYTDKPLTPEGFIVYIARVSNPANQMNVETGHKLLRYLIKHKQLISYLYIYSIFQQYCLL